MSKQVLKYAAIGGLIPASEAPKADFRHPADFAKLPGVKRGALALHPRYSRQVATISHSGKPVE